MELWWKLELLQTNRSLHCFFCLSMESPTFEQQQLQSKAGSAAEGLFPSSFQFVCLCRDLKMMKTWN